MKMYKMGFLLAVVQGTCIFQCAILTGKSQLCVQGVREYQERIESSQELEEVFL